MRLLFDIAITLLISGLVTAMFSVELAYLGCAVFATLEGVRMWSKSRSGKTIILWLVKKAGRPMSYVIFGVVILLAASIYWLVILNATAKEIAETPSELSESDKTASVEPKPAPEPKADPPFPPPSQPPAAEIAALINAEIAKLIEQERVKNQLQERRLQQLEAQNKANPDETKSRKNQITRELHVFIQEGAQIRADMLQKAFRNIRAKSRATWMSKVSAYLAAKLDDAKAYPFNRPDTSALSKLEPPPQVLVEALKMTDVEIQEWKLLGVQIDALRAIIANLE